ncbi:MAG: hypothetical protein Q8S13_09310, partial [Dehalococcoidia bacterium]|nr:hypothetical protein [Dehalococcoidia bacterium]
MADQAPWYKLWSSATDDDDLDALDIADFGRWAKLGLHTKMHGRDGRIRIRQPARTLCAKLQVSDWDE